MALLSSQGWVDAGAATSRHPQRTAEPGVPGQHAVAVRTQVEDYVVGFQELGNQDDFETELLEQVSVCWALHSAATGCARMLF